METTETTIATLADEFGITPTTLRARMEGFSLDAIGNHAPLTAADASLIRAGAAR